MEIFSQSRCSHCGGSHPTEKLFKQQRNNNGNNKFSVYGTYIFQYRSPRRDFGYSSQFTNLILTQVQLVT